MTFFTLIFQLRIDVMVVIARHHLLLLLPLLATVTATTFTWDHSGNSNPIKLFTGIIKDCKNANDCVSLRATTSFFFSLSRFLFFFVPDFVLLLFSSLLFSSLLLLLLLLLTDIICSRPKSKVIHHFYISTVRTCRFSTLSHLQVSDRLHKHRQMEQHEW